MLKLSLPSKINIQRPTVGKKLAPFFSNLKTTSSKDVFELSVGQKHWAGIGSTLEDIVQRLQSPALKKRCIRLDAEMEKVLEDRLLVPPFEKILTARASTLKNPEIMLLGKCLTADNSKYLDLLLEPKVQGESSPLMKLSIDAVAAILVRLARTKESKLVEILSDKTLHISKVLKKIEKEESSVALTLISDLKIKPVVATVTSRMQNSIPEVFTRFIDIGDKLQSVDDSKIVEHVYAKINGLAKEQCDFKNAAGTLASLDSLLDAYHNSKGHYNSIKGNVSNYYAQLDKKSPLGKHLLQNYLFNGKLNDFPSDEALIPKRAMVEDFNKESLFEGLKSYIVAHQKNEPEIANYMYEKYYLSTLPSPIKNMQKKILDEFGTKFFGVNNQKTPKMVYEELARWKKAGGADFMPPTVIDMSQIRKKFLSKNTGDFSLSHKSIRIAGDSESVLNFALRHEIMHCNDRKVNQSVVVDGVDFSEIKRRGLYKQEFFSAGLGIDGLDDYAYSNKNEFVAVAAQGEFSRYSDEFKDVLVTLGMPRWVFKMEQVNPRIKEHSDMIAQMRALNFARNAQSS